MEEKIYQAMKEDVWNLIEGKQRQKINFFVFVITLLLEKESFHLGKVQELAKKLEKKYEGKLAQIEEYITQNYGDIIQILKDMKHDLQQEINPILREIHHYDSSQKN